MRLTALACARLLQQPAEAGDVTLLFGDESEALTHPYLARAWAKRAKRGCDVRVEAPGQSKKRAISGALDCAAHKLLASPSATKLSSDFLAVLGRLDTERSWRDLKRHFLAHQTFPDTDDLDRAIHKGIADINQERQSRRCTNLRIAA